MPKNYIKQVAAAALNSIDSVFIKRQLSSLV